MSRPPATELEVLQTAREHFPKEFRTVDPRVWWQAYLIELEHGTRNPQTDVTGDDTHATLQVVIGHLRESEDYYAHYEYIFSRAPAIRDRRLLPPVIAADAPSGWTSSDARSLIWLDQSTTPDAAFLRKNLKGLVPFNDRAFSYETMQQALKVELPEHSEHADADVAHWDIARAALIGLAHLENRPDYYELLERVEARFED